MFLGVPILKHFRISEVLFNFPLILCLSESVLFFSGISVCMHLNLRAAYCCDLTEQFDQVCNSNQDGH